MAKPKPDPRDELLAEIVAFLRDNPKPMAETTFGKKAVNDGKFVAHLRARKNITVDRIQKAEAFMREYVRAKRAA